MTFRLHSKLVTWNLMIVSVASVILFVGESRGQMILAVAIAGALILLSGYAAWALIANPLRQLSAASRKLAAGDLGQRLPITGDESVAAVGTSLNAMAESLSVKIRELSEGKHRLELIVGAMREGMLVLDHRGRIFLANPSIRGMLGPERDLTGMTLLDVFRQPALENGVRSVLAGGPSEVVEVFASNGRVLEANLAPVSDVSGVVDSVVVVFHDLTDIRRIEEMRRDFVANVSHEFKTPLTSIRGYAETLLSGAGEDPKVQADFLRIIERNAGHLEALVSDLLTLARLESEPPASTEMFDVRTLVDEQVAEREAALRTRRIQISVDCPPDEIQADRGRVETALSNLLDNAIHYNKPGGQIRITGAVENAGFRIAVTDTGHGIPAEQLHRIFERFYRVDKARSRSSGGTGLGLSIVKHAIESQGGSIHVESRLGTGSTFAIYLPLRKSANIA